MHKKFIAPKDFDILELQCDEHNLVQFQMLGKVLKRQEKSIVQQTIAIGRRIYIERYGMYLNSVRHAKMIAADYLEEKRWQK
mgnify:CR=1 FL=1